jgi:hypothetical protein
MEMLVFIVTRFILFVCLVTFICAISPLERNIDPFDEEY